MPTPEGHAREHIDQALEQAGWKVQDYKSANLHAGRGVALRKCRSDIGRKSIQRFFTGNQESMRNIWHDRTRQIAFALLRLEEQRYILAEVERRLSIIDELEATVEANLIRADRLR